MVLSLNDDHVNVNAGTTVQQWTSAVDYLMIPSHSSMNGHAASLIRF